MEVQPWRGGAQAEKKREKKIKDTGKREERSERGERRKKKKKETVGIKKGHGFPPNKDSCHLKKETLKLGIFFLNNNKY